MRPKTLDQFSPGAAARHGEGLGDLIRRGDLGSCIFWGPPGSGKTTLAKIIANYTERHFEPFSAVTEGVARVREIIKEPKSGQISGQGTILFCDENPSVQQGAAGRVSSWGREWNHHAHRRHDREPELRADGRTALAVQSVCSGTAQGRAHPDDH